jgi:hypothetical protein
LGKDEIAGTNGRGFYILKVGINSAKPHPTRS